jgi:hypothetical protein
MVLSNFSLLSIDNSDATSTSIFNHLNSKSTNGNSPVHKLNYTSTTLSNHVNLLSTGTNTVHDIITLSSNYQSVNCIQCKCYFSNIIQDD